MGSGTTAGSDNIVDLHAAHLARDPVRAHVAGLRSMYARLLANFPGDVVQLAKAGDVDAILQVASCVHELGDACAAAEVAAAACRNLEDAGAPLRLADACRRAAQASGRLCALAARVRAG